MTRIHVQNRAKRRRKIYSHRTDARSIRPQGPLAFFTYCLFGLHRRRNWTVVTARGASTAQLDGKRSH